MRGKADTTEVDWGVPPDAPGGPSLRRAGVVLVLVAALVVGGPCVVLDRLHPIDRIVARGRIWRCSQVGGSWPVEAARIVGLRDNARMAAFGAVAADGVSISVVRLEDRNTGTVSEAAFVLGDGAGARLGGLDDAGRARAAVTSSLDPADYGSEIAAARECLGRELPDRRGTTGGR